ncbi:MAG: uroporphyrinogen decarboxylase family protein [Actinomycetota bacterium]|nr:uroporphyrinogen decarboxylase family protein [Actinomycetota bacterium]
MNAKEKFIEFTNFNKTIPAIKWEFGYWGGTIKRWYKEGLPLKNYPSVPSNTINTTASLYTAVWKHFLMGDKSLFEKIYDEPEKKFILPDGIAVLGGGIYFPSQGFALDHDVRDYFNLDKQQNVVSAEHLFYPQFKTGIVKEDDKYIDYIDLDGCTRRFSKLQQVIPSGLDWPIKDWDSWNAIKSERMKLDNVKERLPKNWKEIVSEYKNRDYPLALGGYPCGIFGTLTHLVGYENLFMFYYDKPDLIKDISERMTDIWIALWEEILSYTDVDLCNLWEDISSGKGSMLSPSIVKEFILPYYKKISRFLKSKKINTFLVDTDGDCNELVPLFMESGVTGMYPMEVSAGMDVISLRKKYPHFLLMGGIPKLDIKFGKKRINEFLEPVKWLLKQGGYIPFGDHLIPPEVSWEDFKYYRETLNEIIETSTGK